MAHEFESGFFVRQPAWHRLGEVLDQEPNPIEAFEHSGLNWKVNKCPLFAINPAEESISTDHFAIVRGSDDRVLGVTKGRWTNFQNSDAFEWCVPLFESGKWTFETAGSLHKGERCWVLLRQGQVDIVPGDTINQYLMICWAHDGKTANYIQPTSVRVVCNNTLTQALRLGSENRRVVRHSKFVHLRMDEVRELYAETSEMFENQTNVFREMAQRKLTKKERGFLLDELFSLKDSEGEDLKGKAYTIANQNRELVEATIKHGSGIQEHELAGTAYGTFMGISEAVEHYIGGERVTDRGINVLERKAREVNDRAFEILNN